MAPVAKRSGSAMEGIYKAVMSRTPIYVTFVIVGAFLGERAIDNGLHRLWNHVNAGKRYEDISVLGQRPTEEE